MLQIAGRVFLFWLWFLPLAALAQGSAAVPSIDGRCELSFPADHGPHPEHLIEWWYWTGNVSTREGRPFGFELTFFRSRILEASDPPSQQPSPWRTNQVWAGHFALSDIEGDAFLQSERVVRGAMGLAGAERRQQSWRLNVRDWHIDIGPKKQVLRAQTEGMGLELDLQPTKGPVLHGDGGTSRKGSQPTSVSCYASFPRLQGRGRIRLGESSFEVQGTAWMDHEFASALLEEGLEGWDWFSLQLDDRTEVMFFVLRTADGGTHPASSGTFIKSQSQTRHISAGEARLEILDTWRSQRTGIVYPSGWRLRIVPLKLDLVITPRMKDQEMLTQASAGRNYWEGSVAVTGQRQEKPVTGLGYVELTGYGRPFGRLGSQQ
jgi:predicted secreted hydrolase